MIITTLSGGARLARPKLTIPALLQSYSTSFPDTENPISEGGVWLQLDPTATAVKTVNGNAYGTQQAGAQFAPYDDSGAEMGGFGNDYEIVGTVVKAAGLDAVNREIELRLRWDSNGSLRSTAFGDTHSNGYEIAVQHAGQYMNLGRFKGDNLVGPVTGFGTPDTGHEFRARVVGQRIQVWWNDIIQIDHTDNDPILKITTGNPGFGFFVNAGPPFPANTDFGFSAITITRL